MTKPIARRAKQLLSPDEYEALLEAQGGVCAICGNPPKQRDETKPWTCRYCKHKGNPGDASLCDQCLLDRPKERGLSVDHDHATGLVRGLLCFRCNRVLVGYLKADWYLSAFAYLAPDDAALILEELGAVASYAELVRLGDALPLTRGNDAAE